MKNYIKKCNKIAYPDKAAAINHLHRIVSRGMGKKIPVRAYECNNCKMWHLTSRENITKRAKSIKPSHAEQWNKLLEKQEIKEYLIEENPFDKQMQKALTRIFHNIDTQCEILDIIFKYRMKKSREDFNLEHNKILKKLMVV